MAAEHLQPPDRILNPVQLQARRFLEAYNRGGEHPARVAEVRAGVTEAFLTLSDRCIEEGIVNGERPQRVEQGSALPIGKYLTPDREVSYFHYKVFLPRRKQLYSVERTTDQFTQSDLDYLPGIIRTPDPIAGTRHNTFRGFDEIGIEIAQRKRVARSTQGDKSAEESVNESSTMSLDSGMTVSLVPLGKGKGRLSVEEVTLLLNSYLDKEFNAEYYEEEPSFPQEVTNLRQSLIDYDEFLYEAQQAQQPELQRRLLDVLKAYSKHAQGEMHEVMPVGKYRGMEYHLVTKTGEISILKPKVVRSGLLRRPVGITLDPSSAVPIDPTVYEKFAHKVVEELVKDSRKKSAKRDFPAQM